MARMVLSEQVEFRVRIKKFKDTSHAEAYTGIRSNECKGPEAENYALGNRRLEEWGLREEHKPSVR